MSAGDWFAIVGGACEVGGLCWTAWDLAHTEESVAPGTWRARWLRIEDRLRQLVRRPRAQTIHVRGGGNTITMTVGASVTVQRAPLPPAATDAEWITWLRGRADDIEAEHRQKSKQLEAKIETTRTSQEAELGRLRDELRGEQDDSRALTVRSIQLNWRGLILFGFGAILSTLANLVQ